MKDRRRWGTGWVGAPGVGGCRLERRAGGVGLGEGGDGGFGLLDYEEAELAEAEGVGGKVGGGDAGAGAGRRGGIVGMGDEGLAAAAEVGGDGRDPAVLDCETEVDGGGAFGEALLADGLEELGAVAEEKLWGCCWIPEDVAEAAEGYGERGGDGVVDRTAGAGGTAEAECRPEPMASQSVVRAWETEAPRRSRREVSAERLPE